MMKRERKRKENIISNGDERNERQEETNKQK